MDEIRVYSTVNGGKKISEAIANSQGRIGFESGNSIPEGYQARFVDYPFTKEDATFEDHLQVVQEHEPEVTVSPDVEKGRTLEEAIEMGDQLLEYADNVVIVPKTVRPREIPDRFLVGYPNATFGSDDEFNSLEDYRDVERIHILGGTPLRQQKVISSIGENKVFSLDSASFQIDAQYGCVWTGRNWVERPDLGLYERIEKSLNNIWRYYNEPRGLQRFGDNN